MPVIDFSAYVVPVCVALAMIALDVIAGTTRAAYQKELSSTVARQGLYHKCGFILSLLLAGLCEYASLSLNLGYTIPTLTAACIYIIVIEALSIIENIKELNPEMSGFFSKYFNDGKDK